MTAAQHLRKVCSIKVAMSFQKRDLYFYANFYRVWTRSSWLISQAIQNEKIQSFKKEKKEKKILPHGLIKYKFFHHGKWQIHLMNGKRTMLSVIPSS